MNLKSGIIEKKVETFKSILRTLLNGILALIFFGFSLFLPAGTLKFRNAWIFLGLFIVSFVLILIYFSIKNPEYAKKRFKGAEHEKTQTIVMSLLVICALIMMAISGLDYRFHWSVIPLVMIVTFSIFIVIGFLMLFVIMKQNAYTSRVVEIQEDQKLIDTGMYSIVRHPMYLAFCTIFLSAPIVLGSWYAVVPAVSIPLLLTVRISNEEKVLKNGLNGYKSYMTKVRYRLIPFIW